MQQEALYIIPINAELIQNTKSQKLTKAAWFNIPESTTRTLENHEVLTVTKLNIRESTKQKKDNHKRSKFNFGMSISKVNR